MNKVFLTGRLTDNVEKKSSANGTDYVKFSVAVDKYSKDKQKSAIFVNCVAFGHSANFLAKYCSKGSMLTIEGELDCNTKTRDDGSKVTYWTVVANAVEANKPTQAEPTPAPEPEPVSSYEDDMPFEM